MRLFPALLLFAASAAGAQWVPQQSTTTADLRGVSAVSARVAWASGTRGTVLRTTDGGTTWRADTVPGAGALDFRDVEALDARRAWVLSIGNGGASRIYHTRDGGRNWALQFTSRDTTAFFDCLAFWDADRGIAVSDPVRGRFVVLATANGGRTWTPLDSAASPPAREGEGAFAASGTCLVTRGVRSAWIATAFGARVLRSSDRGRTWRDAPTPLAAGAPAKGVFSLAFRDARRGVAVGGDYEHPLDTSRVAAFTTDGGATWAPAARGPGGYRSGAAWIPGAGDRYVAVGTSGSDLSLDGGRTWRALDDTNLNAVSFARDGSGWAVGPKGTIVRWAARGARRGVE
ncbi:MAG TPA: hypothetical protein VEA99_02150 [Gemmatimonadaceae bacterium]|nr:hypothetical protein [Gemmatimonadaceae bacterium]